MNTKQSKQSPLFSPPRKKSSNSALSAVSEVSGKQVTSRTASANFESKSERRNIKSGIRNLPAPSPHPSWSFRARTEKKLGGGENRPARGISNSALGARGHLRASSGARFRGKHEKSINNLMPSAARRYLVRRAVTRPSNIKNTRGILMSVITDLRPMRRFYCRFY